MIADGVSISQTNIDTRLEPWLHQISELEKQVGLLEGVANELDDYVKRIGKVN